MSPMVLNKCLHLFVHLNADVLNHTRGTWSRVDFDNKNLVIEHQDLNLKQCKILQIYVIE